MQVKRPKDHAKLKECGYQHLNCESILWDIHAWSSQTILASWNKQEMNSHLSHNLIAGDILVQSTGVTQKK